MPKTKRKEEFGEFGGRICIELGGFGPISILQTKSDVLKTGNRGTGKRFEGFCRIIRKYRTRSNGY